MSIVALKRKTEAKYKNVSVNEINGFSLNGTRRLQGYIGQTSLSRHTSFTPMKGTVVKGHGGCCGTYNHGAIIRSATMINKNDDTVVKGSVLNTSGARTECCKNTSLKISTLSKLNYAKAESDYVAMSSGEHIDKINKNCTDNDPFLVPMSVKRTPFAGFA
jgi:ribosomal protein L35AE/L33A